MSIVATAIPTARSVASEPEAGCEVGAFEALHAETARPLWRYVYRTTGNSAVADDVVQESFLRILARPDVLADRSVARPYLYRIASNLLRDRWRRERWTDRHAPLLARSETLEPADAGMQADVQAVLARLPSKQRAMLWLAHVVGYAHAEIATILDLRPASVKVLLHRAKSKLVALLAADGYASPHRGGDR